MFSRSVDLMSTDSGNRPGWRKDIKKKSIFSRKKLVDPLARKAISSVPKLANWTPFAFVVDSFLVGTANYGIGHRDR